MKHLLTTLTLLIISTLMFGQWTDLGATMYTTDMIQQSSYVYLPYSNGNNYIRVSSSSYNTYFDGVGNVGIGHQNQYTGYKLHVSGKTNLHGDVGISIGNTSPQAPLHVKGNASSLLLEGTDHTFISFYPDGYGSGRKSYFGFYSASSNTVVLKNEITDGDVEISTTGTGKIKLAGSVWAKEVLCQATDPWPDFVFNKNYELTSLAEVEDYIEKNNHLPNVPSAQEVKEEGINLGEMDAILLQKIEELTLYTIDQQKQLENQKGLIEKQARLIEELEKKIK
ncbi:MAG: hypothetical protein J5I47_10965 [Vicingus serpentipes]|nr:hypothetical protein [Vicingus serpentipes]